MYLYFLPLSTSTDNLPTSEEQTILTPTHDGGVEHTAARFLAPSAWLELASTGKVILYPPQYFLLTMCARFLSSTSGASPAQQRKDLEAFALGGSPRWGDACISPLMHGTTKDGRTVLSLGNSGREVQGRGRKSVEEWVVLLGRKAGTPNNVEVRLRSEVADLLEKKSSL